MALCVIIIHWPALSAQALSMDDAYYMENNLLVQNPSLKNAWRFLSEVLEPSTVQGYYQSLTMISLMLDYELGGRSDDLMPFHRTSLALHTVNTILIVVLIFIIFKNPWIAVMTGLLFGAHPMTVETIVWVGERKTVLAAFFALLSLISYLVYTKKNKKVYLFNSMIVYTLALMSKPTSVPLPFVMMLMDFWPLNRINKKSVIEKIPFFIIMSISSVVTYISQSRMGGVILPTEYSIFRIPLVFCYNIIFYITKIVFPKNLSSFYPFPNPLNISNPTILVSVIGTFILLGLLFISLKKTRTFVIGWSIFFIMIFPTMQIIGFSNVIAADKFAYLPSIGFLLVVAWVLKWLWDNHIFNIREYIRLVVVGIIIIVIVISEGCATRQYIKNWRNTEILFRYMLYLEPEEFILHHDLGAVLYRKGKVQEAIDHFNKALNLNPGKAETHNDLAVALESIKQYKKAVEHYKKAIQINPEYAGVYSNLGVIYAKQKMFDEAIAFFKKSIEINPYDAGTYSNMGTVLKNKGLFKEAVDNYYKALNIDPNHRNARYHLARLLGEFNN
jgi:predicted negative regulator of RcsB-dependent stress response